MTNDRNACCYCGKAIKPEELLFAYTTSNSSFADIRRQLMFKKYMDAAPLENNMLYCRSCDGTVTQRLILLPNGDCVIRTMQENGSIKVLTHLCDGTTQEAIEAEGKLGEEGMPTELVFRICDAKTPSEIELDDLTKQKGTWLSRNLTDEQIEGYHATIKEEEPSKPKEDDARRTRTLVCPHCHCALPTSFGEFPTHVVSLFGDRAAGKTEFLLSLLQQLNTQLGTCNLGSVQLMEESKTYLKDRMQAFETNNAPEATPVALRMFPLVLRYTNPDLRGYFIIFYDIPGEVIENPTLIANHDGLRRSNTLMIMLDPNMLNNGGYFSALHLDENQRATENQHDYATMTINSLTSNLTTTANALSLDNAIVVATKVDQLLTVDSKLFVYSPCLLKSNSIIADHKNGINLPVLRRVHKEITDFYDAQLGQSNQNIIYQKFNKALLFDSHPEKKLAFLAVSSYTKEDRSGEGIVFIKDTSSNQPKHRIIEPFLLLLAWCGMAPIKNTPESTPGSPQASSPKNRNKSKRTSRR